MSRTFPLAPMSPVITGLTIALWTLPLGVGVYALVSLQWSAALIALAVLTLYAVVWFFCRPSSFVLSEKYLTIQFPAWRRTIAATDITGSHLLDRAMFNDRFGLALRIGVGGLWGGFGWLWTRRRGGVEFYISRLDKFVFVEKRDGYPLLVTPQAAEEFHAALQRMLGV